MSTSATDDERVTYRHLRIALIALTALLAVGTVLTRVLTGVLAESISGNYAGPLRNVFVGALVGLGVCLVAYHGRALEELALNFAGFYAMFVAFVPSTLGRDLDALDTRGANDSSAYRDAVLSVQVSTIALLVVAVAFVVAAVRSGEHVVITREATTRGWRAVAIVGTWVAAAAFVLLVVVRVVEATQFAYVHGAAAVLLIVNLALVVACNAGPDGTDADPQGERGRHVAAYRRIVWAMTLGTVAVGLLAQRVVPDHVVLVVEWWAVLLFAAFWSAESVRLWPRRAADEPTRAGATAPARHAVGGA